VVFENGKDAESGIRREGKGSEFLKKKEWVEEVEALDDGLFAVALAFG